MAEKNSLWKNIRKKAEQNRRTGAKPKKPTAEMLRQERKIKAKQYPDGGPVNTLEGDLISKVIMNRNRDKDFVQRAYAVGEYPESNMFVQPDVNEFGQKNSHLMGWGEDESGQAYMYPEVMNPNNEAIKVPNQYADYISSTGYKKATGIPYAHGGPVDGDDKNKLLKGENDTLLAPTLNTQVVEEEAPQWMKDKESLNPDEINFWESFNPKKWGLNDYSNYSSFNSAFRNARESGEKEFVWNKNRYTTDLIPEDINNQYWDSKKFLQDYYINEPFIPLDTNYIDVHDFNDKVSKDKYGYTWTEYYDKVSKTPIWLKDSSELSDEESKTFDSNVDTLNLLNRPDYYSHFSDKDKADYYNYQKRNYIDALNDPNYYFSITSQPNPENPTLGYHNAKDKKLYVSNTNDRNTFTTFIHELSHKGDSKSRLDYYNESNRIPKVDIDVLNKFGTRLSQDRFEYVNEPSETEARKMSTLYFMNKNLKKDIKSGKIKNKDLTELYNIFNSEGGYGESKSIPDDVQDLLELYKYQWDDLLKYLNNDFSYMNNQKSKGGYLSDDDVFKSNQNQGSTIGKVSQDWLANWVQNPEFATRLNRNFPAHASDLEKKIYGNKEARERASAANLKTINKIIPDIVNDIYDTQFLYNTNPEINTGLLSSYKSRLEDPKSIKALERNLSTNPQGFTDEQGRIIITNEANTQYGPQSVGVHELIHKVSERDKTLDKLFRGKFQTPSQDRIDANYDKDEMYPFLMQMRFDNKFQPGEEITPERLKQIRDSGYRNHLFRYYNDDEISKYLNTLASNQTQAPIQYAAQGGYMYPDGGKTKVYTDPKEFKKAERAYNDSLSAYKAGKDFFDEFSNSSNPFKRVTPNEYHIEAAKDIFNTNINPSEIYEDPNSAADIFIPLWKKPEIKPVLEKPTVDKLQSKQYSNFSSNQQPSIVGNIENIQPSEINMDKFYEGQYEKYRRSPYEDPMYRVWVPGQQMQIVPEEEFKKLNDQYALKDLEQKAQGGRLYAEEGDGEDPVTLYKKAQYDPNTGKILEYAGSQGNEYYVTPNTPQGIDFQRTLPELEIIDEYNSSKDPYGNKMNIASEKGAIRNPNYQPLASGKLDIDPAGQLLLAGAVANPSNLLGELASEVTMVDPTSLVKNVGNKILKTTKDIKSAADEFVVTPIQFRKEIAELKKLKNDYSNIFNTDEGKKRLGLLGIDPSKISDYDLTFKPNIGSAYSTGFDDFINKMNIDFREIQKLKKKGYIVSPKSIFEHEMGHLLQKESYKQKGIFKDIDKYNQDLIEYNKIEDRILNNPYMTNVDKSLKLRLHRLKKPIKPFITTKPTLIDEGAKQLTRNNSVIDDKKIAAAVSQGKDVLSFPEKSYSYFNYGTDVERFAHLREMRQNMIESGVIKNMYDPITSEHLAKFIANNPGDRVSSFVDTSPNNIEWLKTLLNNMPAAVPVIGVGAGAIQSSQPEQQSYGGPINPYMYYSGGPMYYDVGGKVWKNIAAGLYGAGEGILDTVTMGATDQLTDKGFEYLTKVGNKNLDLNDPEDVKFLKTQQQIKGYSNAAGAIGTAVVTGNVQGAIGQGTKGLNTAFQASDWASDDFKKWSQGISGVAGMAAGFAGGLNSDSFNAAAKAGTGIAGFGQKAGKIGSFGNQVTGMFGGNQQPLWQQGEARQELLNSPEYLAMKEKQNQAYVNQGLSFASTGGNINNSLNLQNSMRGKYNSYKRRYSKGGTFQKFGINEIPDSAGYHHENAYGGVPIGPNAMAEGGEFVLDNNYVVSDEVDGMNTQTDEFGRTMAQNLKRDLSKYTMRDLNSKNKDSLRRPMDPLAEQTINQIKQKAMMETEMARAEAQAKEQERQAMVEGALQYAAAGGKLNKDITKIVEEEYAAAYGGRINPKKYKGLNMPYSSGGKLPKEVLRARVEAHMSPQEADAYVENYAKGGGIHIKESKKGTFTAAAKKHGKSVQEFARQVLANKGNYSSAMVKKANFARNAAKWHHAEGGDIRPNNPGFNALPEYVQAKIMNNMAHGGPVVSNVNQDFDLYAQNRGGMMMANGGMMMPQDDSMSKQIATALQQGADPQQLLQQLIKLGMDPQQAQLIIEAIMGKMQTQAQVPTEAPMMAMGGTMYAPGGGVSNFQHMRNMLLNKTYRNAYNLAKGYNTIKPKDYPNVFTEGNAQVGGEDYAGLYPMTEDEAKKYQGYDPTKVNQSTSTSSLGTGTGNENIFGDDKLGKALAIGQAAIPLGEAAYHIFNKPKHIKAPVIQPATVDYSASRIIDQRQTDMAENAYLNRLRNSSSTSGMFANNAKEYLLQSNAAQAGRNAISVQDQMNKNAEETARANALNAQYGFSADQLNYDIDQARIGNIFGALNNAGTTAMQGYGDIANRKLQEKQIASTQSANVTPITGADGRIYMATKGPDGYYFNGQRIAGL